MSVDRPRVRRYEREGLAEEFGPHRSGLHEVVHGESAADAHHHARDILCRHRKVGRPEVPRTRLEAAGEGLAKLGLARDVALSELSIADREAPVLALEQQRLARVIGASILSSTSVRKSSSLPGKCQYSAPFE
jgi:alpha-D-ribose 1-methylphosphonate 5-triphosphate synthase subunit PhnI